MSLRVTSTCLLYGARQYSANFTCRFTYLRTCTLLVHSTCTVTRRSIEMGSGGLSINRHAKRVESSESSHFITPPKNSNVDQNHSKFDPMLRTTLPRTVGIRTIAPTRPQITCSSSTEPCAPPALCRSLPSASCCAYQHIMCRPMCSRI